MSKNIAKKIHFTAHSHFYLSLLSVLSHTFYYKTVFNTQTALLTQLRRIPFPQVKQNHESLLKMFCR